MPVYKLTYFGIKSRGEIIRLAFAAAGVEFEDFRISPATYLQDWPPIKASGICPFDKLPILEVDGKVIAESKAILKYVCREYGLAPTDNLQIAVADMIVQHLSDIEDKAMSIVDQFDPEIREANRKKFIENVLQPQLRYFEKILADNNGGKGFFVGDKMTYADIDFFALLNSYVALGKAETPQCLEEYPLLRGQYDRVLNEPKILKYIKTRPETIV